jgi:hypothetical protein
MQIEHHIVGMRGENEERPMTPLRNPWLWLTGAALLAAGLFFLQTKKTDARLPCQQEVVSFEKWRGHTELLNVAYANLEAGNYRLEGTQTYAYYMPSDLNGTLQISEIDALFIDAIAVSPAPGANPLMIAYELIENDKLDPRKKNPPKKPFSGYLVVAFLQNGKELYRFQIDYLDPQAADLDKRVDCVIDSFLHKRTK